MPAASSIQPSTSAPPDWQRIAQALLLVVATVVCYLPSLGGGFLWDDRLLIADDPLVKSLSGLWNIWFSAVPFDFYPLTYSSHWLEWHLWGDDPFGYRLVNLGIHLAGAFLFWRLLQVWRLSGAWLGALLFALHPLNVASAAWIAERKNGLSLAFSLATMICWARSEEESDPRRRRRLFATALAMFALALLSKSSVVMLPCVLLIVVWQRRGAVGWKDVLRSAPFFALSLAAGLVSVWFQRRTMGAGELAGVLPMAARVALIGKSLLFYLGKIFWPYPLAMIYPRWSMIPLRAIDFLPLAVFALAGVTLGWAAWRRRCRGPAAALAWFAVTALPVAGLFHMTFYTLTYVSDHLIQISIPSLIVLCAASLAGGTWGRRALVILIAGCAVLTWQRAAEFGSSEKLWAHTLAINPTSAAAQINYGLALDQRGKLSAAEAAFRTALRQEPTNPDALTDLAAVLQEQRRWPEAATAYQQALVYRPSAGNFNNYGVVLLYLGDAAGAGEQFRQALALDPTLARAHYNLYKIALVNGDAATAANELRAAEALKPIEK